MKTKVSKENAYFVKKGWGSETWITNSEKYCGKVLFFKENKKCSIHYHKLKDETFYVGKGAVQMTWADLSADEIEAPMELQFQWFNERKQTIELNNGDSFYVPVGRIHQVLALEDTEVVEFSTEHFDSDSYRLQKR